jgi:RimJ/RimL family protein N-acetyltransferase
MRGTYLETERLRLRYLTEADAENLYELDRDPAVTRYTHGPLPTPLSFVVEKVIPRLLSYYERDENLGFFAAEEKETDRFIGWFHFRLLGDGGDFDRDHDDPDEIELGYRLRRDAWGKGYATEGSIALVNKGFEELGFETVVAIAMPENRASIHVMEKLGMQLERSYRISEGGVDVVKYRLERADWGYS